MSTPLASASSVPAPPKAGTVLAERYEVERVLGAGGMGFIVAARHVSLGHRVALKFLHDEAIRRPEAVARFLREARVVVKISSEHVVRIVDMGTLADGAPFLAMEYLDGVDLAESLRARGPLPVDTAVEYVLQACEALAEAHALGVVHRDLKPANLFLCARADGSPLVKVIDFGIAKVLREQGAQAITSTGDVFGTPQYMSPEQLRGSKEVDARTDVWALGAILYELISGHPPFEGPGVPSVCAMILVDPPAPLSRHVANPPAGLEAVLVRCLEKDPAARFPDVGAFAEALAPFAPPRARVSIDRAQSVARHGVLSSAETARAIDVAAGFTPVLLHTPRSLEGVASTRGKPRAGRTPWIAVGSVAAAAAAGALVTLALRGPSPSSAATASSSAASAAPPRPPSAAPPPTAAPEPVAAPSPKAPALPSVTPVASPRSSAPPRMAPLPSATNHPPPRSPKHAPSSSAPAPGPTDTP
ncbi:MAG TPA: serine/threonine-protein kinase [Byssovorax sp.]|jgi:serine/threonine-protein kinase